MLQYFSKEFCNFAHELEWPIISHVLFLLGFGLKVILTSYQRRQWHPTPVLLPGKSHGWRSLVGCGPWSHKESDTTERLHFHFSLSCIGEGNGNPLQCSCLENPRDGGAWWAAVYGVTLSQTRLQWLSSRLSSSNNLIQWTQEHSLYLYHLEKCESYIFFKCLALATYVSMYHFLFFSSVT